jgi:glucose-6-phosphate dehydrogenase assembly protein OpcA
MEDAVSTSADPLLPGASELPFAAVTAALGGRRPQDGRQPRAQSATVVTIGPDERLRGALEALAGLASHTSVRALMISPGSNRRPTPRLEGETVVLPGLDPAFVNNAVAALRLSSLPTIVWWRGGKSDVLARIARLADRVVIDDETPRRTWRHAERLFETAAFSDLRWTRLTRWRTLMANFFDIPEVRAASARFTSLAIRGADPVGAALFASWLSASLGRTAEIDVATSQGGAFLEEVRLGSGAEELVLELAASGSCVKTAVRVEGHRGATRTVTLGDQSLQALMTEELRVRARDRAFETAVRAVLAAS